MPKFYVLFFLFLLTGKLNAQFDDLIVWSNADKYLANSIANTDCRGVKLYNVTTWRHTGTDVTQ